MEHNNLGSNIGDDDVTLICDGLTENTTLTTLSLW